MKTNAKTLRLLFLSSLAILVISIFSSPLEASLSKDDIIIVIAPRPAIPEEGPRTTVSVPFYAEYNDLLDAVIIGSVVELEDVSVMVDSSAGDWYQTVFDTEDGPLLIPVSGDSGHYSLTLITSDNTVYVGEFDL